jgi:hypothetical protein
MLIHNTSIVLKNKFEDTKLEGVKRRKIDNKMVKRDGTK